MVLISNFSLLLQQFIKKHMNRNRLLQIISKDLLELSEMTNETAENELVTNTEIDFLLRKTQVIIQGFELFKELNPISQICLPETQTESIDISETEIVEQEEVLENLKYVQDQVFDQDQEPESEEDTEEEPETEDEIFEEEIPQSNDDFGIDSETKETWFEDAGEPVKEAIEDITEEDDWFETIEEPIQEEQIEEPVHEEVTEEIETIQEEHFVNEDDAEQPVENEPEEPVEDTLPETVEDEFIADDHNNKMQEIGLSSFLPQEDVTANEEIEEESDPEEQPATINDTYQQSTSQVEEKINESQLVSLDDTIGINDRFQFIRELFNNDSELFSRTIEDIDDMNDIKEAAAYLNKNFKWKKNEFSLKFIQLIKRRFS